MKTKDLKQFISKQDWLINKSNLKSVSKYKLPAIEVYLKLGHSVKQCIELADYAFELSIHTERTIEESAYDICRCIESFNAGIELSKILNKKNRIMTKCYITDKDGNIITFIFGASTSKPIAFSASESVVLTKEKIYYITDEYKAELENKGLIVNKIY